MEVDSDRIIFAPYTREKLSKRHEDSIPLSLPAEYAIDCRLLSLEGRITLDDIADCLKIEDVKKLHEEYPDGKLGIWATRSLSMAE